MASFVGSGRGAVDSGAVECGRYYRD